MLRTSITLAVSACRMTAKQAGDMLGEQIQQYKTTLENLRKGKIKPKSR